jgi:FlaG/FlaF family flagellin (archaellin)
MKSVQRIYFLLLLIAAMLVGGCGGDDNDPQDGDGDGTFTATVAGTTITSNATEARAVLTKNSGTLFTLYVQGWDIPKKRMINFFLYSTVVHTPGSFSFTSRNNTSAFYIENKESSGETAWISPDYSNTDLDLVQGTVTVTELTDTRVKGTFSFTAKEDGGASTRSITGGAFDVPLTRQGF